MNTNVEKISKRKSFLDEYQEEIAPKLREIDIFIKSSEYPVSIAKAAKVLYIDKAEMKAIMKAHNIKKIYRGAFFKIMENGGSEICRMYKRELEIGSPFVYSDEDIAYIYNLDRETVRVACEELRIKQATSFTLPVLFSQIPVND